MKRLLLPGLCLLMSFCLHAQDSDTTIIKKLNRQFLNSLVQEDSAALSAILAEDFVLINPGGMRRTRAENLHLHNPGQHVDKVDIDKQEVRFFTKDVGAITVWTTNYVTQGNQQVVFKICYMDIYRKRNDEWKAVAAHVTLLK
jgi:hypothetical protein